MILQAGGGFTSRSELMPKHLHGKDRSVLINFTQALLDVKRTSKRKACTCFSGFTSRFCRLGDVDRSKLQAYADFSIPDR